MVEAVLSFTSAARCNCSSVRGRNIKNISGQNVILDDMSLKHTTTPWVSIIFPFKRFSPHLILKVGPHIKRKSMTYRCNGSVLPYDMAS